MTFVKALLMTHPLSKYYLITPDFEGDLTIYLQALEAALQKNKAIKLVQLRSKNLTEQPYRALAKHIVAKVHEQGAKCILNGHARLLDDIPADGVHYPSRELLKFTKRPMPPHYFLSAACHNAEQLQAATQVQADLVTLSPIFATPSSPQGIPIGWERFAELVQPIEIPVYALGGLCLKDLPVVEQHGGYGIAAKRSLWA